MPKFRVDPISRIEGHLKIECRIERKPELNNEYFVAECKAPVTMFRGFEIFLRGRDPRDAVLINQRICGVCPHPHALATVQALDDAFDAVPPPAAVLIRNIASCAYYIYDHLIHFYLLIGPELAVLMGPEYGAPILPPVLGKEGLAKGIGTHYAKCVEIQRRANQVVALWTGKFPHAANYYPGGVLVEPTLDRIAKSVAAMVDVWEFVALTHIQDIMNLIEANERLKEVTGEVLGANVGLEDIGVTTGNFLSYGMLPWPEDYESDWLNTSKREKSVIKAGCWYDGSRHPLDENKITEDAKYSWYDVPDGLHPWEGQTVPNRNKPGAYTWTKAPRYDDRVCEVGPLARMLNTMGTEWRIPRIHPITGENYGDFVYKVRNPKGSVLDRVVARAACALICANVVFDFLKGLATLVKAGMTKNLNYKPVPKEAKGRGLWEAPRGALGHWVKIKDYKIDNWQAVVPGTWNWSPRDSKDRPGAGEHAIQCGTTWIPTLTVPELANALYPGWGDTIATALTRLNPKLADLNMEPTDTGEKVNATLPLIIVRSFDPCLACGVHIITPSKRTYVFELKHGLCSLC
ncbi:MAG: cytochrome-c3 hydrogenase [Thermoproteota archaeon]|nr:MAG: cytochrome-c3 hydrogenase [Candidatus Korarchaeota archaeon]